MSTRRDAREWVIQLLFHLDMNPVDTNVAFDDFWKERTPDAASRAFAEELVRGTVSHLSELDAVLQEKAQNWSLARMGGVERNVLRMAVYELLHRRDIPPVVTINEAVDIAKYFSGAESGHFINGILDRVREGLDRPARTPADGADPRPAKGRRPRKAVAPAAPAKAT